jgi:mannosyl-3-phosphoglycerate synthase
MLHLQTIRLNSIWNSVDLNTVQRRLREIAFVVCHKDESAKTLWTALWHLPADSSIVVVTNCAEAEFEHLKEQVHAHLPQHHNLLFVHQKDAAIADFFKAEGVSQILDENGKVRNGKGEGMYMGTLVSAALQHPRYVAFYDSDNHTPSTLLAYTLALSRLFSAHRKPALHNVRICWLSKPDMNTREGDVHQERLGRCTRVVSPLFDVLVQEWFGEGHRNIISSNAGEQAMTMSAAKSIRFSSGYSVESFHLMEMMFAAHNGKNSRVDQYVSQSPFFHTKKDNDHINRMIASSMGAFLPFREHVPYRLLDRIEMIETEIGMVARMPHIYPAIDTLDTSRLDLSPYYLTPSAQLEPVTS